MVFSGTGGLVIICLLGTITVLTYVGVYIRHRFVTRSERRPPVVFVFDLLKILVASGVAFTVNYTFTAQVSYTAEDIHVRGKRLEGIGWYAAMCTADTFIGAPLSLLIGRGVNCLCRYTRSRLSPTSAWYDLANQNAFYGKYSDEHHAEQEYTASSAPPPPLRWSWWYSQTVTWTLCNVLSGIVCGLLVLYSFILVRSKLNPITWIAVVITYWSASCLTKQWIVVAVGRTMLAFLQLLLVDTVNRFTASRLDSAYAESEKQCCTKRVERGDDECHP